MRELGTLHAKVGNKEIAVKTSDLMLFSDGFSFQVENELAAFQAAYIYRNSKRVKVEPLINEWMVSVYK